MRIMCVAVVVLIVLSHRRKQLAAQEDAGGHPEKPGHRPEATRPPLEGAARRQHTPTPLKKQQTPGAGRDPPDNKPSPLSQTAHRSSSVRPSEDETSSRDSDHFRPSEEKILNHDSNYLRPSEEKTSSHDSDYFRPSEDETSSRNSDHSFLPRTASKAKTAGEPASFQGVNSLTTSDSEYSKLPDAVWKNELGERSKLRKLLKLEKEEDGDEKLSQTSDGEMRKLQHAAQTQAVQEEGEFAVLESEADEEFSEQRFRRQANASESTSVNPTSTDSDYDDEGDTTGPVPFLDQPIEAGKGILLILYTFPAGLLAGYLLFAICFYNRNRRFLCCTSKGEECLASCLFISNYPITFRDLPNLSELQVSRRHGSPGVTTLSGEKPGGYDPGSQFESDRLFFQMHGVDRTTGERLDGFTKFRDNPNLSKAEWAQTRMIWWLSNDRYRALCGLFSDPDAKSKASNLSEKWSADFSSVSEHRGPAKALSFYIAPTLRSEPEVEERSEVSSMTSMDSDVTS